MYSRSSRLTTEKQQQKYVKDINSNFMKMISNLSNKSSDSIVTLDDVHFYENINELIERQKEEMDKFATILESNRNKTIDTKKKIVKPKNIIL